MKLLTKTTLYFLTLALFILFIGGIGFYFIFKSLVKNEVERELSSSMHKMIFKIRNTPELYNNISAIQFPDENSIKLIDKIHYSGFWFYDTVFVDKFDKKIHSFRALKYQTTINQQKVQLTILKSLNVSDELIEKVTVMIFFLTLLFLLALYVFNRFSLSHVWKEFFQTISIIKNYNISENKVISINQSDIQEFNMLFDGLKKMSERIRQDYINLKEFTENTSHEIQTPLAIIKTKIDLLLQNENLDENQLNQILAIQASANRLSNLNKALILLTKIENNQFTEVDDVEIIKILDFHLDNFEDIIETKKIKVKKIYSEPIILKADHNLINILLLNLLKNAINHNLPEGNLEIEVNAKKLIIKNTGKQPNIEPQNLFTRYSKASSNSESLGLGLSIVKEICDRYNYRITYHYKDSIHSIEINF